MRKRLIGIFAILFFFLSILLVSLPADTLANAKPLDLVWAEKVYNEWTQQVKNIKNKSYSKGYIQGLWDEVGNFFSGRIDNQAAQIIMKKYNLSLDQWQKIQNEVRSDDFKSKQIDQQIQKRVEALKRKNKKIEITDAEHNKITRDVRQQLDPQNIYWNDYIKYKKNQEKKDTSFWSSIYWEIISYLFEEIIKFFVKALENTILFLLNMTTINDVDVYGKTADWFIFPDPKDNVIYRYQLMVQQLAWAILGLFLTYHGLRVLALYTIEVNPTELRKLLLRFFVTSLMIYAEPYIIKGLLTFNRKFSEDLAGLAATQTVENFLVILGLGGEAVVASFIAIISGYPLKAICIFFIIVLSIIVVFQLAIRFAEISLLAILGPLAIVTNMNEHYNLFPSWWKNTLSTIFTVSVQYLLLVIMFGVITSPDLPLSILGPLTQPLLIIGFLYVIFKTPAFLREWIQSSGAAQLGMGVGVNVATSVTKTAFRILKP